jgi:hypothetical protein
MGGAGQGVVDRLLDAARRSRGREWRVVDVQGLTWERMIAEA